MKPFFTRLTKLFILFFFPVYLLAQENRDYRLLLNSGTVTPEQNLSRITKNTDVFQKGLFSNKYYVTIQFTSLPDPAVKSRLGSMGIVLIDYIPNFAYTASVPANFDLATFKGLPVRSVINFTADQKITPSLAKGEIPAHAVKQGGFVDVVVTTYDKISAASAIASINAVGATLLEDQQLFRNFVIRVPQFSVKALASLPFIQWVEPISPPNVIENLPGRTLHRVNILNDGVRNLKGDGINVGIWDGGPVSTAHLDFSPAGRVSIIEAGAAVDHATHCAGTITGKGIVNPVARGMAPNANLFSWNFNGNIQTEMAAGIPANNLLVSSHSYGFSFSGACNLNNNLLVYESISRNTDINLNNFPSHLHVHSAGNSGGSCSGGFHTITGSGKQAKNNLVVADISTTEAVAGSSSRGPLQDGRIKPEISAMGTNVFSTWIPNNNYATISGTSMATPGIAGASVLLYQRYKQLNGDNNPPSALIKNILCNASADLGNVGPDYTFGFGRVNALASVKILEDNRYVNANVATGAFNDVNITIPAGTVRLRAMLTWNDPAGAQNANPALVNDLDLSVVNGATTTLPWILDKNSPGTAATRGVDNYGNIEQVTVVDPPAGTYTLKVNGTSVPVGPNQEYSLTWIIDQQFIEVLYPNGGENLSPGSNQTITWDNAGITSTQVVEFSLDNGATWTTISNSVPANTTRLVWNVPAANTSTALIRITSGATTDVSDLNFRIMGIPTGFAVSPGATCNSGEISYTWPAVQNATHYDIVRLDEVTGAYVTLASDITGTSYTATGLTAGSTIWAALIAKNNTTGAISERSNAVSGTVSSGGGGLSPIGSITGATTICGALQNVTYTVPSVTGATSYTWTAPPNTTIATGQGTNTITVNYFAGSTSGNVTVFASSGACQTSTATLAVTVNSTPVAAPTSGGDQTQNQCPPAPITTLTASATVPAGHTLTWYDAPTGGNVVGSPTLSIVGTITYHASSRNNTTNCESVTRTAVKLTINSAPPATVTTSGPTTFCQGGTVTLTANAGDSYLWNTGSTSQAIAVTTGGSYTVTVTQIGGCTLTSAPVVVTVNPTPTAAITASGAISFCDGDNVVLTASQGSAWLWSNGATTQSISVNAAGAFSVRVTNASGCFANSAPTTVTVSPNPVVTLSASPYTDLFPGLTTTLTATVNPPGTYVYTWRKNGTVTGFTGTSQLLGLEDLGSYTVTVTNASGLACSNTSGALVIGDSATSRLFVYPNPTSGVFQVNFYTTTPAAHTLSIIDSRGAVVYRKAYTLNAAYQRMDVDIRQHGRGVYQVVLHDKSGKKLAEGRVLIQ